MTKLFAALAVILVVMGLFVAGAGDWWTSVFVAGCGVYCGFLAAHHACESLRTGKR
jgi:hypothetical protein